MNLENSINKRCRPQFSRKNRFFGWKIRFSKHSKRCPSTETSTISTNSFSWRHSKCDATMLTNNKTIVHGCTQNITYLDSENIELELRKMSRKFRSFNNSKGNELYELSILYSSSPWLITPNHQVWTFNSKIRQNANEMVIDFSKISKRSLKLLEILQIWLIVIINNNGKVWQLEIDFLENGWRWFGNRSHQLSILEKTFGQIIKRLHSINSIMLRPVVMLKGLSNHFVKFYFDSHFHDFQKFTNRFMEWFFDNGNG